MSGSANTQKAHFESITFCIYNTPAPAPAHIARTYCALSLTIVATPPPLIFAVVCAELVCACYNLATSELINASKCCAHIYHIKFVLSFMLLDDARSAICVAHIKRVNSTNETAYRIHT